MSDELQRIVNDLERCVSQHPNDQRLDETLDDLRCFAQMQQQAPPTVAPEPDNPQSMTVTFFNSRVCEVTVLTTTGRVLNIHSGSTTPKYSLLLTGTLWGIAEGLMLTRSGNTKSRQSKMAS